MKTVFAIAALFAASVTAASAQTAVGTGTVPASPTNTNAAMTAPPQGTTINPPMSQGTTQDMYGQTTPASSEKVMKQDKADRKAAKSSKMKAKDKPMNHKGHSNM